MEEKKKLSDELREIFNESVRLNKEAIEQRKKEDKLKIDKEADRILAQAIQGMYKAARDRFNRYQVIKKVDCSAVHVPNSRFRNVCRPSELMGASRVVYDRLKGMGLNVSIDYWQDKDHDEPGAYIAGFALEASW